MKKWQHGIELDTLQSIQNFYDKTHNKFSFSPFTEMNKPAIAREIDKENLFLVAKPVRHSLPYPLTLSNVHKLKSSFNDIHKVDVALGFVKKVSKVKTAIKCFDNIITYKKKGDITYTNFAYDETYSDLERMMDRIVTEKDSAIVNEWYFINEEDSIMKSFVERNNLYKVCTQYKSTSEIIGVYSLLEVDVDVPEYEIPAVKFVTEYYGPVEKLTDAINDKIDTYCEENNISFSNHYSNYNKKKSWSALSIRGYDSDVTFIEKPAEVTKSKKWKNKYKPLEEYYLQNTELYDLLKLELDILLHGAFPNCQFDRIRLMKLEPNGGELLRHSDLQDPDVGVKDGKQMRFHIPIRTNPNVQFSAWDWNGIKKTLVPTKGRWLYLDQRKPHTVLNAGDTERIHLVVDVIANQYTRGLITR